MLDASDSGTFPALLELTELARAGRKPLVIWVGAGTSSWAGLPTWAGLAEECFADFSRKQSGFDSHAAEQLLREKRYPAFFGLCNRVSATRYARLLNHALQLPTTEAPVYRRFLDALKGCGSPHVVTTNVDELLERGLGIPVILPANLEMVSDNIANRRPFVAKLHGTIGDHSSLIFTEEDYARLLGDRAFLETLKRLFAESIVLFVGYGLADEHVLNALSAAEGNARVFGTGPHFCCSTSDRQFPDPIRVIRYVPEPHKDHRSSIQVLEEVSFPRSPARVSGPAPAPKLTSAHMLADCTPPGTWDSSQRVEIEGENGDKHILYHGHGLVQSELPFEFSTALHDLVVGLLCFDRVYVAISYLGRLHDLVGGMMFAELIKADTLRFVATKTSDAVVFEGTREEITGFLSSISFPPLSREQKEKTVAEQIRSTLTPAPGRVPQALALFDAIEAAVVAPSLRVPVPDTVRSLLLRPSIRSMLGMSQGTKTGVIPKWLAFPVLRLATVARLGNECRELELGSVKFGVGNDKLAAPVFAATFGEAYAETVASYVIAGNFQTDLGAFAAANPTLLNSILRFRDTPGGQALRSAVLSNLSGSNGADVAAAINGGLQTVLGTHVLESARGAFANLFIAAGHRAYPAAWFDTAHSQKALGLWRKRSIQQFEAVCKQQRLSAYDPCPCGSGERLKFCCSEALLRGDS